MLENVSVSSKVPLEKGGSKDTLGPSVSAPGRKLRY